MFALLRVKKNIFKTTFILKLANKKFFKKNRALLSLFFTSKLAKTILNILKIKPLIFCALTLVERTFKSSFNIYSRVIALTLLSKLIKACI